MKFRKRKSKRPAPHPAPVSVRRSKERQIILLDQGPLRRQAATDCSRQLSRLEKAKAEWKRFQSEDKAAYDRWTAATFGALLSRLRETEAGIHERQALVREVEAAMFFGGHRTRRAAYAEVMRRRSEPPNFGPQGEPPPQGRPFEDDPFDDLSDDDLEFIFEDILHMAGMNPDRMSDAQYEKMFRDFKAGMNEGTAQEPAVHEKPKSEDVRIKEIYRLLVRRLHPDTRADVDAEVSALWHEVQEAYGSGNLERLEMLLALTDIQFNAVGEHTSLFQMRSVLVELRRAFNALQKNLRAAKKDPAWGFGQVTDRTKLEAKLRKELEANLKWQLAELRQLESEIASWTTPPKTSKKKPGPAASQTDFAF